MSDVTNFNDVDRKHYKFYYVGNKTIATTKWDGRTVKAVAKCSPNDTYNRELGERIAYLRCKAKISKLKYNDCNKLADFYADLSVEVRRNCMKYIEKSNKHLNDINAINGTIDSLINAVW